MKKRCSNCRLRLAIDEFSVGSVCIECQSIPKIESITSQDLEDQINQVVRARYAAFRLPRKPTRLYRGVRGPLLIGCVR